MNQCYACENPATTTEHIPPKCLFPERKDLPKGLDLRKNLITVPSCAQHNTSKTTDDEYLLYVLASNIGIKNVGLWHWATKLKRSMEKRPSKLGIFRKLRPIRVNGVLTGMFDLDYERIKSQFILISKGLFFHHTGNRWLHEVDIFTTLAISQSDEEYNHAQEKITSIGKSFLSPQDFRDDNPEVFSYQYLINSDGPGYIFRMIFYQGIEVIAFSEPSGLGFI